MYMEYGIMERAIDQALESNGPKWSIFVKHNGSAESPIIRELNNIMEHAGGTVERCEYDRVFAGPSDEEARHKIRAEEWAVTDEQTALGVFLHLADWEKRADLRRMMQSVDIGYDADDEAPAELPVVVVQLGFVFHENDCEWECHCRR